MARFELYTRGSREAGQKVWEGDALDADYKARILEAVRTKLQVLWVDNQATHPRDAAGLVLDRVTID